MCPSISISISIIVYKPFGKTLLCETPLCETLVCETTTIIVRPRKWVIYIDFFYDIFQIYYHSIF